MFFSVITYASDADWAEELKVNLLQLNSAARHIKVEGRYANEIKIQIAEKIKHINRLCHDPVLTQGQYRKNNHGISLTFICHEKIDYQSYHFRMPEGDIIHHYVVTLTLQGEITALVSGEMNLKENNLEDTEVAYFYQKNVNSSLSDDLVSFSLEVIYAGHGYKTLPQYAELLFPDQHDKYLHILTGKMTSDFFTALSFATIEPNRQNPWRSKLIGVGPIALIAVAKEIAHDKAAGRGTPDPLDAVASTLGGLVTHFEFTF